MRKQLGLARLVALAVRSSRALLLVAGATGGLLSCGPRETTLGQLYADRPDLQRVDSSPLAGRRILIDPGHGGFFAGSRGAGNTREADVNLGVGLYLWGLLHDAGADVHLTRSSDRDLLPEGSEALRDDLAARVALLDSLQPEVFLSLHHNSNAALDRERNAVETYFKLDDEGPSYDLARAVHRYLAGNLGIDQAALRPGNYFVLRESSTAAILGEASYLSNPDVESRLRLAEKQLLEAEAYFLGLIDYFSRGIPRLRLVFPEGDTLQAAATLQIAVERDGHSRIDPLSLRARINGRTMPTHYDNSKGLLLVPMQSFLPGVHHLEVHARNLQGNAAAPLFRRLVVWSPPHEVRLRQDPEVVAPGSAARLRVELFGAQGHPVADGVAVSAEGIDCDVVALETLTRGGHVLLCADGITPKAAVRIIAAGLETTLRLEVDSQATVSRLVQVHDARSGKAVNDAWVSQGTQAPRRSDRAGLVVLQGVEESLEVQRTGYVPQSVAARDSIVLQPLHDGVFLGLTIVLDPGGNGLEPTEAQWGVSTAQLAFDMCARLQRSLEAAGAHVVLTRGPVDDVPDLDRIRLAGRVSADLYVRIAATLQLDATPLIQHYPNSQTGTALANGIAYWLHARQLADSVSVTADTQPVLLQTPCPAVVVHLPGPRSDAAQPLTQYTMQLRQRIYAVQMGLRQALVTADPAYGPLLGNAQLPGPAGRVPDVVILDGADVLDVEASGDFRFEAVNPGSHRLTFLHQSGVWEHPVQVVGADSTLVQLQLTGAP